MSPLAVMCERVEMKPLALISPATPNAFDGVVVPIPTFEPLITNPLETFLDSNLIIPVAFVISFPPVALVFHCL